MKTIAEDVEEIIKERRTWERLAWLSLVVNVVLIAVIIFR